ncbi:MAG: NifB/NifX family molybdenum-iron cluster-binding protein [Bacteroidales bacterium]
MKIAIASTGNETKSRLSPVFSRCNTFVFFDSETHALEFFPNPFKNAGNEAGNLAMQLMVSRGVDMVVGMRFGQKIKQGFDSRKICMVIYKDPQMEVGDVVRLLNKRKV